MKKTLQEEMDVEALLLPENDMESRLIHTPEFKQGLMWGKPRYGHPEGKVVFHIREVLDNIDLLTISDCSRDKLRLVCFVHDTFKYLEQKTEPRDWSKHHGILGRRFFEDYHSDEDILDIIELHDEAYYCWRQEHEYRDPAGGQQRLERLLGRINGDTLQLYYLFFKCDTRTGDKIQAPLKWFEKTVGDIDIIDF